MFSTQCFHCHGSGSVPGWGTKTLQTMPCDKKGMMTLPHKIETIKKEKLFLKNSGDENSGTVIKMKKFIGDFYKFELAEERTSEPEDRFNRDYVI